MPADTLVVRLNMDLAPTGMELLTPGASMRWGKCRFELNPEPGGEADFSVVLANARPSDRFFCARGNTLLIVGEPSEKKVYPQGFYKQFGHVLDTHEFSTHPGLIIGPPGLNWHVGLDMGTRTYRFGYDYLTGLERPDKLNRIAVVCSSATATPGQRKRLELLDYLKRRLGDRIVHFGRGFEPIDDKMDAILPYRFHLVLENSRSPNYWTEKLADAYLGWAHPIYHGCPNVEDFFPSESLSILPDGDFEAAASLLMRLLNSPVSTDEVNALKRARSLVLNRYNSFAWSACWAETLFHAASKEEVCLFTHKVFRPFPRGIFYRLRKAIW